MCGRTGDGWSEMKKWMNPLKNEESSQKWRPRHRCFIRIHWGVKNGERNGAMRTGTHATSGLNHSQPMTPTKLAWHQVQSFLLISPFHRAFGTLTAVIYLSESDDRAGSDWQRWSRRGSWSRLLPDQRKALDCSNRLSFSLQKRSQPETLDIEFTLNVASSDPNMTEPDVANQTVMVNHTTIPTSALFY